MSKFECSRYVFSVLLHMNDENIGPCSHDKSVDMEQLITSFDVEKQKGIKNIGLI